MLEICADDTFEKEKGIQPILSSDLKGKLLHDFYYYVHRQCEEELKTYPISFKEKWK